jgi:hypothetical protein
MSPRFEATDREDLSRADSRGKHTVDLGEAFMNYATLGDPSTQAVT